MADDNTDNTAAANLSMPDPFTLALTLCQVATNAKAIEPALKRLRKLGHDIEKAERKLAAVTTQAEQTQARLAEREAALNARDAALDERATEFESSLQEARDNLRGYYDNIAEADRHIRYRILASADLLSGYNPQLQDLPSWDVLKRLVVGLPDDPPPLEREVVSHPRIDALSDTFADPRADRHGAQFLGTLTRDVSHHRAPSQEVR
jgi:hypothetical protein